MSYNKAKIYFDGSHFIAIPQENFPKRKKKSNPIKEKQNVCLDDNNNVIPEPKEELSEIVLPSGRVLTEVEWKGNKLVPVKKKPQVTRISRKELFEKLYKEFNELKRKEKREKIIESMLTCFKDREQTEKYVDENLTRKVNNAIVRKIRLCRKAYLQRNWNYFATFTYSDELHTEETFKEYLRNILKHRVKRKDWKYIGVWERGGKNKRLHFHALMYIPDGTMDGENVEEKYFDTTARKMRSAYVNTYFTDKIGRCDFEPIFVPMDLGNCLGYLLKYIEKSNDKIVYGGKLPTGIISTVLDDDILCSIGIDDKKAVLYDKFLCITDDGEIIGEANKENLDKLPKWF
ncbi:MAG: hypothetical protein IJQ07_02520 [Clostridia bacterium]|nr:hypothetical protein [Clostridia bacterium]